MRGGMAYIRGSRLKIRPSIAASIHLMIQPPLPPGGTHFLFCSQPGVRKVSLCSCRCTKTKGTQMGGIVSGKRQTDVCQAPGRHGPSSVTGGPCQPGLRLWLPTSESGPYAHNRWRPMARRRDRAETGLSPSFPPASSGQWAYRLRGWVGGWGAVCIWVAEGWEDVVGAVQLMRAMRGPVGAPASGIRSPVLGYVGIFSGVNPHKA